MGPPEITGGGTFDDWRLPDFGDLSLLYENLHRAGLGGFTADRYRSVGGGALHFGSGVFSFPPSAYTLIRTRAVRTFSVQ